MLTNCLALPREMPWAVFKFEHCQASPNNMLILLVKRNLFHSCSVGLFPILLISLLIICLFVACGMVLFSLCCLSTDVHTFEFGGLCGLYLNEDLFLVF